MCKSDNEESIIRSTVWKFASLSCHSQLRFKEEKYLKDYCPKYLIMPSKLLNYIFFFLNIYCNVFYTTPLYFVLIHVFRFTTVAQGFIKLYITQNNHNYFFSSNNIFLRHEILNLLKISPAGFRGANSYVNPNVFRVLINSINTVQWYNFSVQIDTVYSYTFIFNCIQNLTGFKFEIDSYYNCFNMTGLRVYCKT